jgi:hypothetical protein
LRKALHARYVTELNPLLQQLQQQYTQQPHLQKQPLFSLPEISLDVYHPTTPLTPLEEKMFQTFYLRDVDAKYYIDLVGQKLFNSFSISLDWCPAILRFWYP